MLSMYVVREKNSNPCYDKINMVHMKCKEMLQGVGTQNDEL